MTRCSYAEREGFVANSAGFPSPNGPPVALACPPSRSGEKNVLADSPPPGGLYANKNVYALNSAHKVNTARFTTASLNRISLNADLRF